MKQNVNILQSYSCSTFNTLVIQVVHIGHENLSTENRPVDAKMQKRVNKSIDTFSFFYKKRKIFCRLNRTFYTDI